MNIPAAARNFALKHKIGLIRDHMGCYMVRDRVTLEVVDMTLSANPTPANAVAMMRRVLVQRANGRAV